ncbi:21387_t:CDS:2 [Gigaspora margarita]|uniref:21387_t:CDS:1 n=1 Tax=Gigaspora margarita TaxID=4874 RepID=A0ABN7UIF8_GIGMA|nr:21387_t:CDS:2 [Gigaspora margarita]
MASTSGTSSSSRRMDTTSFGSNDSFSRNKKRTNQKSTTNSYSQDSFVWSFFKLVEYEEEDEIVTKVQCDIEGCNVKYTWHNSTSNLINHLRDVHHITKMSLENKKIEELKKPIQQKLETVISKPYSKLIQQKLTQNIVKFFLLCTLPLFLIENENFRTFLNTFDPRYKPPCINTLEHEIPDAAFYTAQTIKYMINTQADIIALTFDLWTSRAHNSYLGITCHWISDEFKMYDLTLSVTEMGEYKTASNIVSTIEPILEEFGISGGKLVSITTDNGSNVKAAVTQLSEKISPLKPQGLLHLVLTQPTPLHSINNPTDSSNVILVIEAVSERVSAEKT